MQAQEGIDSSPNEGANTNIATIGGDDDVLHYLEMIRQIYEAIGLTPNLHEGSPAFLTNLGVIYHELFDRLGNIEYLHMAVDCGTKAVALTPDSHPDRPARLNGLGHTYKTLFTYLGELKYLHMAVDFKAQAVALIPDSHPDKPVNLSDVGIALETLYHRLGKLDHLHMANNYMMQAVALTPDGHPDKPVRLSDLGGSYQILFGRMGELEHLYIAIECKAQAAALTPDGHPDKLAYLNNLGLAHHSLFNRLGKIEHLHIAKNCMMQVVALTPDGNPDRSICLSNLATVYRIIFHYLGEIECLHIARDLATQAVALTPDDHPDRPSCLDNLGLAYGAFFDCLGEIEDLGVAISCMTQAVALTLDDHPEKPARVNNLGSVYHMLFDRLGEPNHLHIALDCRTYAVSLTPDGHPDKPGRLSNLGLAYMTLYNRLGELEHLHTAINNIAQAIALTPDSRLDKPGYLNNLGIAYGALFDRLGEINHLHMAVDCNLQALALAPDGDLDKLKYLSNLGDTYGRLFNRLSEPRYIYMAVDYKAQVVELAPDGHPDKPAYLSGLGIAYWSLFSLSREHDHLHMTVDYMRQAVALTPDSHQNQSTYLGNLGIIYKALFNRLGNPKDLPIAIDYITQAASLTKEDYRSHVRLSAQLGELYHLLFAVSHQTQHIVMSICYSQFAAQCQSGDTAVRLNACLEWARGSMHLGSNGLKAHSRCIPLFLELMWLGTSVQRRYELLASELGELVSGAAITAISANRFDLAVEWLEQGRCMVWNQMLQLRTPLDTLHASHPELADQLYRISRQLEITINTPQEFQVTGQNQMLAHEVSLTQSQLADARDKIVDKIRLLPGFNSFLRPPTASKLTKHIQHGFGVIVNVHMAQCDAFVINSETQAVMHVPLRSFSHKKAEELCQRLSSYLKGQNINRGVSRAHTQYTGSFRSLLATLWSDVVKPVLDHLDISQVRPIENLPHITWCITGPLSFLPVHAAGIYDSPDTILPNLAISSYTPNISSMSQSQVPSQSFSGILAVGHQTSIRGLSPLPGTEAELDCIQKQFTGRKFTRLYEETATTDAVLKEMEEHSWVHFACHASQDPRDPLKSALHLHDKDLDLATISKYPRKNAQLAFLSACQTAAGDSTLPDEVVHLAAGLMMAGYPSVIATMWSIADTDAPVVAEKVYEYLLKDEAHTSRKVAKALHSATKYLRDVIGVEKFSQWVPYIHLGG